MKITILSSEFTDYENMTGELELFSPKKWVFNLDYDAIGNELAKAD